MNKLFLKMVMLPSALWKSLGADIGQLKAILGVRLMLDDRKPRGIGRGQKVKKDRKYSTIFNAIFSAALGLVYMLPLFMDNRIFSLAIYFFFLLSAVTLMLITDFSNVLFDARDKYILFLRPVNDRTIVLARILHVFIYVFRIVLPMSLPGWVLLGYLDGWKSVLLFPFILVLLVSFALFLVNIIYLLILNITKAEKFKDIIGYFQILSSAVFFASIYLLPRLFDSFNGQQFNIFNYTWARFVPSYWLAVCWSWIGAPVPFAGTALLSVLAVCLPLLCMYILVKWLAPSFSQKIAGIDTVDAAEYMPRSDKKLKRGNRFYQKIAYVLNRTDESRAGFMMAWLQTSRSRSFKMRVYPGFATLPIYFFVVLTRNHQSLAGSLAQLQHNRSVLMMLYMTSIVLVTALTYLCMSDQYKAAWIYYAAPVEKPGSVMVGAFKAIWVKYFLPFFILLSVFILYTWGVIAILDVVLALVNATLFVAFMARVNYRHLPFSVAEQMKQGGNRVMKSFLSMIVPLTLCGCHYFLLKYNLLWLEAIFLALSSILLWLVLDSYGNTTWASMIKAEDE